MIKCGKVKLKSADSTNTAVSFLIMLNTKIVTKMGQ